MLSHDDSSASGSTSGLSDGGRFVSPSSVAGSGLLGLHPPLHQQHQHQHQQHQHQHQQHQHQHQQHQYQHHQHLAPPPPRNMATWQSHQSHQHQHHLDMTSANSVSTSAWGDVSSTGSLRGGSAGMGRDFTSATTTSSSDSFTLAADVGSATGSSSSKKAKKASSKKDVFICSEVHCGKQFPRSFALRRHQRIHTGNKPYACDEDGCTQRFNTSGNLSRHKRIHSGERPYPCIFATCGKRFNTSTKLKRHMRIHFPDGQKLFRCIGVNCSWSCDNYKEFAQHQRLHHGIIVGAGQQSQPPYAPALATDAAVTSVTMPTGLADQENDASLRNSSAVKGDSDYFMEDHHESHQQYHQASRHEYDPSVSSQSSYQHAPSSSSSSSSTFLYSSFSDKSKAASSGGGGPSPLLGPRKLLGPPFFGSSGDSSLSLFPKESKRSTDALDQPYAHHRSSSKSAIAGHSAFPLSESPVVGLPQYHHSRSSSYDTPSFSLSSDASSSSYARSLSAFGASHYGGNIRSGTSSDGNEDYDQHHQSSHSSSSSDQHQTPSLPSQQHHHHLPTHHVLRPPPQHDDAKFGGFSVPPPMNPAAPEFTGEELSVVLELMKDSYC